MNLIVDGHAYLNVISPVALYVLRNNATEEEIFDSDDNLTPEAKEFFKGFFLRFLGNIMFPYKNLISKVYITLDKDSWRKYYTNKYCNRHPDLDSFGYKENRDKSKAQKTSVYKLFNLFIDEIAPELSTLDGITVISVRGAEGDDIIAYLSNKLNDHNIIWSGDTDLCQLLKWNDNITFMVTPKRQGKNIKKVYIPIHEKSGINLTPTMQSFNNVMTYFNMNNDYEVEESDFNIELLVKIIGGDRGDNVMSVYHYLSDTGRRMNVSEAQARSIVAGLLSKYDSNDFLRLLDDKDDVFLNDIVDAVFLKKNLKKKNDERNLKRQIRENLEFNINMIRLSNKTIPPLLIDTIEKKLQIVENKNQFNYMEFLSYVKMEDDSM